MVRSLHSLVALGEEALRPGIGGGGLMCFLCAFFFPEKLSKAMFPSLENADDCFEGARSTRRAQARI